MAFQRYTRVESIRPIKDEGEKKQAQKTAAKLKVSKTCCGDPAKCGGCDKL